MNVLNDVGSDFVNMGVSGFDNSEVLRGRPYGGRAIIWRSSLLVLHGRLINLFLVDYRCVMLNFMSTVKVMKLGLCTLQWNCYAYVNTHGNLVITITCFLSVG